MAHQIPENLKYTKEHEWVLVEGDIATIGITDYAQSSLGDIVFVELPETNSELKANASFGVVESIKSVSDLYSPVTGTVVETNTELESTPEEINNEPYSSWIIKIKCSSQDELNQLLSPSDYSAFCEGLE